MGPIAMFADPGKYQYYFCEQLASKQDILGGPRAELQLLMDKAKQGRRRCQRDCLPEGYCGLRR